MSFPFLGDPPLHKAAEILAEALEERKAAAHKEIAIIQSRFEKMGVEPAMIHYSDYYSDLLDNTGLFLAVFEKNELVFWSDNRVAFDYLFGPGIPDEQYLRLDNGWYGLIKLIEDDREYYALFLIRTAYPYQNVHLKNNFEKHISLPNSYHIVLTPTPTSAPVEVNGQAVFQLERTGRNTTISLWLNFLFLLFGISVLLYGIEKWYSYKRRSFLTALLFPASIILVRVLSLNSSNPFVKTQLFDPALYASSFLFPSLGDLLINSFLLVYIGYFIFRQARNHPPLRFKWWSTSLLLILCFAFALFISPLIIGLIENSRINFNLNDVFHLQVYTFLAVLSIGMLLFAFTLFAVTILTRINWEAASKKSVTISVLLTLVVHTVVAHLMGIIDFKIILWPLPALGFITLSTLPAKPMFKSRMRLLTLMFFALLSGMAILKYSGVKEKNERIIYAGKLASDEDPVTEVLFSSVAERLQEDDGIRKMLAEPSRISNAVMAQNIEALFIDRYWNKYDFTVHIYKPDGSYWGVLPETRPPELAEFNHFIHEHGYQSTASPYLFHLYNFPDNLSYLAKVPVPKNDSTLQAWVVIGLESTLFPDEIGFPELLIDQSSELSFNMKQYSYARYVDEKLVSANGNYNYRISTRLYEDNRRDMEFENYNNYNHLIHRVDERTIVVVSKENPTFFDQLTVFIYLFVFFGLLLLLAFYLHRPTILQPGFFNHLNVKIQMLSAGIILIALLSFGVATRFYTERQFREKNQSILNEKIQSVIIELEGQLKNETEITDPMVDQLRSRLTKLSYVFFTDINVYDTNGILVASSQPKIFEAGLIAPRMNSEAYVKMVINKKSEYIHEEKLGELNHLSAYVPFRNINNDIVAYVNLPYFARQDALEDEIARLFVTLVNIFVLLLALSIIAAIFISDRITRPLQKLQQSLSRIELGRQNEQIEYKGTDVIGNLVSEYNRKVTELEIKAEQLARSERESAWREMARQVAHEIKNPLTPMKLNIQLLQKAVSEGSDNLENRIQRTSDVLIEQIDTLSQIANAFSNFAQMPRTELAEVDLNKLIASVVELYRELPGSSVTFTPYQDSAPVVHADYNQLLRAIQNLIKNSLQAAEEHSTPEITISVEASNKSFLIRLSDNGKGIPPEMQDKIFQPNFTTKSTGMGLGLAMVQSIVQNINGKIWFETESGKGSTFYIEIPAKGETTPDSE